MTRLINSYTRYFNTKYKRVGPVFQGVFKAVHIESDEQLIHVSRYIHLNPLVSFIITEKNLFDYPWSSLNSFIKNDPGFINPKPILDNFPSINDYKKFVQDHADYGRELQKIKHLTLEK
jgi:putative transposase